MTTAEDAQAIASLKSAVCCACNSIRVFVMGTLFGALLLWLAAVAGLYIASELQGVPVAAAAVAAPVLSCPAPVIDVDRLAAQCMDFHNKPKGKK